MQLTCDQLDFFQRNGYLLTSEVFFSDEIDGLKRDLAELLATPSERRIFEKNGGAVRSVYAPHWTSERFARLARHPRLLEPARALLGDDVYLYQYKANTKAAFVGDVWEWHQDYVFWRNEDGMPEPRAVSAAVLLDEVTEYNGPLILIPGSQRGGSIEVTARNELQRLSADGVKAYENAASWVADLIADISYSLPREAVRELVLRHGMEAPKAPAGSVLWFDCNVAHASGPNLSPFDRALAIATYNAVGNHPARSPKARPDFLVNRDATPLRAVADDSLLAL